MVLHLRYTAREAGHLRAAASTHVKENVLQDPESLLQLFALNYEFGAEWHAFKTAATDADRSLDIAVTPDRFPYWVKPLGMDDAIAATFAVTDRTKRKLTIAPAEVAFDGDAGSSWSLSIDDTSPVFAFLNRNRNEKIYMAVSYAMRT